PVCSNFRPILELIGLSTHTALKKEKNTPPIFSTEIFLGKKKDWPQWTESIRVTSLPSFVLFTPNIMHIRDRDEEYRDEYSTFEEEEEEDIDIQLDENMKSESIHIYTSTGEMFSLPHFLSWVGKYTDHHLSVTNDLANELSNPHSTSSGNSLYSSLQSILTSVKHAISSKQTSSSTGSSLSSSQNEFQLTPLLIMMIVFSLVMAIGGIYILRKMWGIVAALSFVTIVAVTLYSLSGLPSWRINNRPFIIRRQIATPQPVGLAQLQRQQIRMDPSGKYGGNVPPHIIQRPQYQEVIIYFMMKMGRSMQTGAEGFIIGFFYLAFAVSFVIHTNIKPTKLLSFMFVIISFGIFTLIYILNNAKNG
ncbi:MAG: hypothetical protein EZS28_025886, partial [Streblomastix strix]